MIRNYLTIAWRNLIRTKTYSIINITGLTMGMTIALLVGLWVFDELSFNKSFRNYGRLAQVHHHVQFGEERLTIGDLPAPLGEKLKNSFPDFEDATITSWPTERVLGFDETRVSKTGLFVEPQFATMFSIHMAEGSNKALKDHRSILVSRTFAETIGNNVISKIISIDGHGEHIVSGVFEDFPSNSSFDGVQFILPLTSFSGDEDVLTSWENYSFQCFVQLRDDQSFEGTSAKIKKVLYDNASNDGKSLQPEGVLLPMERWHLYNDFNDGENRGKRIHYVWMFGLIGIFVLMLACINFINLTTARAEMRSKEVGVRKVMGSARRQLIFQFLSESFLMVILAFLASLAAAALLLPWFNALADKRISLPWTEINFIAASMVFIVLTGLLAGSYPALYLSGMKPVKVLKGTFKAGRLAALPRKALVVFQFATSFILTIGTIVIFLQIQHAKDRPVGFDREGIIFLDKLTEGLAKTDYNALRNELLATGVVENMATSDAPITGRMSADASLTWEGKDPASQPLIAMNSCSHDFPRTNGFVLVEGRDFSREFSSDSSAVIINEMAAKLISNGSVIGKTINFGHGKERKIVGVIEDQVRWSAFSKQSAHLYFVNYEARRCLTIRLHPQAAVHDALNKIGAIIRKFDNKALFEYEFVDDDYAQTFHDEERMANLTRVFSALALVISCIGMFGLAAFASGQRTKEIGIRKVLGASAFSIWQMLCGDFLKVVLVGIVVGTPLGYYFSNKWLTQYDYRIEISWGVFGMTAILAMLIALFTVSYQALRAAMRNPVNSLKAE